MDVLSGLVLGAFFMIRTEAGTEMILRFDCWYLRFLSRSNADVQVPPCARAASGLCRSRCAWEGPASDWPTSAGRRPCCNARPPTRVAGQQHCASPSRPRGGERQMMRTPGNPSDSVPHGWLSLLRGAGISAAPLTLFCRG
jgi:hypothetical protein